MSRTLYVTDLDGTLMRNDKTISEYTISTLNDLIDKGLLITYATARSFVSSYEITKDIHFSIPVINRNGSIFADQINKREIEIAKFCDEEVLLLKGLLNGIINDKGFITAYYDGEMRKNYLEGVIGKGFKRYVDDHNGAGMYTVKDYDSLFEGMVTYVTLIASESELRAIYTKVKDAGNWEILLQKDTYSDDYWLEIFPKNSSKAQAVLKLKEKCGCDRVVVFGDSVNDISMFEIADEACAVANGLDEVKRAATKVILSNEEDGVAKYLMDECRALAKKTNIESYD